MRTYFLLLTIMCLNILPTPTFAETSAATKKVATEIYQEFLSPFCPGRALSDCPSSKAEQLKDQILLELNQGQTKETVLRNLETEFGSEFNAKPKLSGFAGLAWLIPLGFILAIAGFGYFWAKGNSHKEP